MKTRSIALALVLSIAPAAALAQDDATTQAARARFREGVEFYDKGQYEQARAAFLQAYALKKHPDVLLNLAQSSLKAGKPMEAEKYFQQFLREAKDISPDKREKADKGIAEARTKLGRIEIAAPAGSEVTVDGERIGNTPVDPIVVEPGAHMVKVKTPDGNTDTQSVSVLAGQQTTAKFGKAATTPPTPPPPPDNKPATPPDTPPPATPATPPETTPPPASADTGTTKKPGLFAPPKNPAPAYILGGVAVGGFIGSIIFLVAKNQAQDNANKVASEIATQAAKDGFKSTTGICSQNIAKYQKACDVLRENNDAVNTDATLGNVFLGVGILAAAGAVVYWIAADKEPAKTTAIVVPSFGPGGYRGLALEGRF